MIHDLQRMDLISCQLCCHDDLALDGYERERERERESLFAISVKQHNKIIKHKFKQWQAARKVKYHHSWPPMIIMNNH